MHDYRLTEAEKTKIAEMLNSKKSAKVIPGKLFLILMIVSYIITFVIQAKTDTTNMFFAVLIPILILMVYILYKASHQLDSSPYNRMAKEFEEGEYICKIANAKKYYHDNYKNCNIVRYETEDGLSDECIFFGQQAPEVVVLYFKKKRRKRAFALENLDVTEQRELDLSADLIENIDLNDYMHQSIRAKYQPMIEKLTRDEKRRGEQHGDAKLIFYQEKPPVQMYKNVRDNTEFVYKNRVLDEGPKVVHNLKGFGRQRKIGKAIQLLGLMILILLVIYAYNFKSIDWNENFKQALAVIMLILGPFVLPIVGGVVRSSGRKYMIDYINVAYMLGTPLEINRLNNGQLVVMSYASKSKSCSNYLSALSSDDTDRFIDTAHGGSTRGSEYISTYVDYMYIIDSVKSCTRTKNGLMVESSGRYYGIRPTYSGGDEDTTYYYYVFAEKQIIYRKEEIPAVFADMDQLETELNSYTDYQVGQDAFVPF